MVLLGVPSFFSERKRGGHGLYVGSLVFEYSGLNTPSLIQGHSRKSHRPDVALNDH